MELFCGLDKYNWKNVTLTTGMFDGVHKGHMELIKFVVEQARQNNQKSVLVTFQPHPRYVVNSHDNFKLLTTYNERVRLMSATGLDGMIVLPFTTETSQISHDSFLIDTLVNKVGMSQFIYGYDHRFGKNREGSYEEVLKLGKKFNFDVKQYHAITNHNEPVSSTRIREALATGDMHLANQMLGYTYGITGKVVKGVQIGRKLGFPTANIEPEDQHKLIPGMGVYAVTISIKDRVYHGMLNIGIRPTVHSNAEFPTIEVNIFDFNEDIYDEDITVGFVSKIRDEMKFDGLESLSTQLTRDKISAKQLLEESLRH